MSESVRSPQVVAVEYAPFPLTREEKRERRAVPRAHGLWALKLQRMLHWSLAVVRQRATWLTHPLTVALTGMDTLWRALGERTWRLLYAFAALAATASCALRMGTAGLAGRLGYLWYQSLRTFRRRLCKRVTLACLFSGACLCLIVSSFYTLGLEVYLNGKSIGFVSSPAEFTSAVEDVSRRAGEILHYPYYPHPEVTYRYAVIDRSSVFNEDQVEAQLFSQISDIQKLNVLTVDGDIVAVTPDGEGLQTILDGMLDANDLNGTAESVAFAREVSVTTEWTDAALVRPLPEIAALLSSADEARYDEMEPGETLADVARRNGMCEEDLRALNGLNQDAGALPAMGGPDAEGAPEEAVLPVKLLVRKASPFLAVDASRQIQVEEEIPYTSVTVSDDTIYVGDTKVRTKGEPGTALVTMRLIYRNGEEIGSAEAGRETVLAPVQEVIAEGAKERPAKAPTGKFTYPYYGQLTSPFGYRSAFGGQMHSGMDLAGPTGSPIVAADGGVVTFAGYRNGYGNCIEISHGNGLTSMYGHCSKLLVSGGQAVAKGELIAKVGSTGHSTGPHLHFEIRLNGSPVNPRKYIG